MNYNGARKLALAFTVLILVWLVVFTLPRHSTALPIAEPLTVPAPTAEEQRTYWVLHFAGEFGVDSALALAVSRTENWRGIRDAWSPNNTSVGVMQVNVSVWYGNFDEVCGGSDLMSVRDNACYGVLILKYYLDSSNSVEDALRQYVGHETLEGARGYTERVGRRLAD